MLDYGSDLQKTMCASIGIPEVCAKDFWNDLGAKAVEEALHRKRSSLLNSLTARFRKYCQNPRKDDAGELIPPPDPFKVIPNGMMPGM